MPFAASFSVSQTLGDPSEITFSDTSTGTDGNITERRIYLRLSDGLFLVESGTATDYETWDILDISDTLDVLDEDEAIEVTIQWLDVSGTVLYVSTANYGFTLFNSTFDYQLTQRLSGNPLLINDNNFFELKSELRVAIDSGNDAIAVGDLFGAQQCYIIATNLRLNSQYYFNANS